MRRLLVGQVFAPGLLDRPLGEAAQRLDFATQLVQLSLLTQDNLVQLVEPALLKHDSLFQRQHPRGRVVVSRIGLGGGLAHRTRQPRTSVSPGQPFIDAGSRRVE